MRPEGVDEMRDVNKIVLRGVVPTPRGRVSLRRTETGQPEREDGDHRNDETGAMRERPAWHRVAVRGERNAEVAEGLAPDSPVYVEGQLRTRKYRNQEGEDVYSTEVRADIVRASESAEPGVNRSIVLGNLGQTPELRKFDNFMVMNLRIATSESWTRAGRGDERRDRVAPGRGVRRTRTAAGGAAREGTAGPRRRHAANPQVQRSQRTGTAGHRDPGSLGPGQRKLGTRRPRVRGPGFRPEGRNGLGIPWGAESAGRLGIQRGEYERRRRRRAVLGEAPGAPVFTPASSPAGGRNSLPSVRPVAQRHTR